MKLMGILVGVLLLLVFGFLSIKEFDVGSLLGFHLVFPNALYYLFGAPLVVIPFINFAITITRIILGLAILCIVVGLIGK